MAKVLIFDDDVVLRDFLKPSLPRDGYDVCATGTRSHYRRASHDAVLADIERPFTLEKLQRRLKMMGLTQAA